MKTIQLWQGPWIATQFGKHLHNQFQHGLARNQGKKFLPDVNITRNSIMLEVAI